MVSAVRKFVLLPYLSCMNPTATPCHAGLAHSAFQPRLHTCHLHPAKNTLTVHQDQLWSCFDNVENFYRESLQIVMDDVIRRDGVVFNSSLPDDVFGLARWWYRSDPSAIERSRIEVRPGLSALQTEGILAHEVFHLYSARRALNLTQQLEEGAANLVQYLYFKRHAGSESQTLQQAMFADSHVWYGDGFRTARRVYRETNIGFSACLKALQTLSFR